jgi:hypothetical protein
MQNNGLYIIRKNQLQVKISTDDIVYMYKIIVRISLYCVRQYFLNA